MRKIFMFMLILAAGFTLSSCSEISRSRAEIEKTFIVRIISIDKGQAGKVKVTLTTKDISSGGGEGGGQAPKQSAQSIVAEGETMFQAVRSSLMYSEKRPRFGHSEYILFGEDVAREGILPYLDFVSREGEFRYNAKLYIVKGGTASSIVQKTNTRKAFVGDRIASIEQGIEKTSFADVVTLNEAMVILDNKQLATFIPYLEVVKGIVEEQKQDQYDVALKGYAIFKGDKLLLFTTQEESRGINWLMNRISSSIIVVKGKNGETVSLEVIDSKSKRYPKVQGDELYCPIKLTVSANVGEIMGSQAEFSEKSIEYLEKQLAGVVKKEVEHMLDIAQEENADYFGIITSFGFKYPMMRDWFAEEWKELFPKIKFDVEVEANVCRTYLIKEPTGGK